MNEYFYMQDFNFASINSLPYTFIFRKHIVVFVRALRTEKIMFGCKNRNAICDYKIICIKHKYFAFQVLFNSASAIYSESLIRYLFNQTTINTILIKKGIQ